MLLCRSVVLERPNGMLSSLHDCIFSSATSVFICGLGMLFLSVGGGGSIASD